MAASDVWILVIAAGAVTQGLRYLPVLLLRWRGKDLPAPLARTLESAGIATIGGLVSLAVFRSPASPEGIRFGVEEGLKLGALVLAFVLYVWSRRSIASLLVAYSVYVLLTLC